MPNFEEKLGKIMIIWVNIMLIFVKSYAIRSGLNFIVIALLYKVLRGKINSLNYQQT